jgi:predicted PurR-regulated permease PerM
VADEPSERPRELEGARAGEARARSAAVEARALGTLAVLATLAVLWLTLPVGVGVLVGMLLAFTLYHSYRALVRRTRHRTAAALGITAITTVVAAGAVASLLYLLVLQGVTIVRGLPESFAPGGRAATMVERVARPLSVLKLEPADIADKLRDALGGLATSLAGWAASLAGFVLNAVLALFFMAITMFFILRHWTALARRAEDLMPLNPAHTRRLLRELRRLGRQVVIGNIGTGIVQGAIAGVGYAVARIPAAAFLGAITAVAALVPAFGTMLVWVPAGLLLLFAGRVAAGVFVFLWGSLAVVGFCDSVLRPKLVGRGEHSSMWLTFVALFGGIKLFGFVGFLLGPLIVGMAVAALRLYGRTRRVRLGASAGA